MEIIKPIRADYKKCLDSGRFSSVSVIYDIEVRLNNILIQEGRIPTPKKKYLWKKNMIDP